MIFFHLILSEVKYLKRMCFSILILFVITICYKRKGDYKLYIYLFFIINLILLLQQLVIFLVFSLVYPRTKKNCEKYSVKTEKMEVYSWFSHNWILLFWFEFKKYNSRNLKSQSIIYSDTDLWHCKQIWIYFGWSLELYKFLVICKFLILYNQAF